MKTLKSVPLGTTKTKSTKSVKAPETKKEKVIKAVTPVNKTNLVEGVISNREVKYIYPEDVVDTLSRKSWRQQVRNKLNQLEMKALKITDKNSKEFKQAIKAFENYQKTVTKV